MATLDVNAVMGPWEKPGQQSAGGCGHAVGSHRSCAAPCRCRRRSGGSGAALSGAAASARFQRATACCSRPGSKGPPLAAATRPQQPLAARRRAGEELPTPAAGRQKRCRQPQLPARLPAACAARRAASALGLDGVGRQAELGLEAGGQAAGSAHQRGARRRTSLAPALPGLCCGGTGSQTGLLLCCRWPRPSLSCAADGAAVGAAADAAVQAAAVLRGRLLGWSRRGRAGWWQRLVATKRACKVLRLLRCWGGGCDAAAAVDGLAAGGSAPPRALPRRLRLARSACRRACAGQRGWPPPALWCRPCCCWRSGSRRPAQEAGTRRRAALPATKHRVRGRRRCSGRAGPAHASPAARGMHGIAHPD